MNNVVNLDMDVLRTFVLGFELGSFARAATACGRSQSAVSGQLRKLEAQVGEPLVRKTGRGLEPTDAGAQLLLYARRLLDLNDEAVATVRSSRLEGKIRFGLPGDFADTWLPDLLGRFSKTHPRVRIEVQAEGTARLLDGLTSQRFDLVLGWGGSRDGVISEPLAEVPAVWIGRPGLRICRETDEAVTLVLHDAPCIFRSAGLRALEEAALASSVAFTSSSLPGLWAALAAGLGISVRTTIGMPASLAPLDGRAAKLPSLPTVPLTLHRTVRTPDGPVEALAELVRSAVRERMKPTTLPSAA
jgi:DNA-binding transcriptional LysR family regulator